MIKLVGLLLIVIGLVGLRLSRLLLKLLFYNPKGYDKPLSDNDIIHIVQRL